LQYHGDDTIYSRHIAEKILQDNFAREHPLNYDQLDQTLKPEDWLHRSRVLHFFEQVGILHQLGNLDEDLLKATILPYFEWWYTHYLDKLERMSPEGGTKSDWDQSIKYLATRLRSL
jgi:hypothetical protein